ncbi:Heat shock protein DnaJ N-terminal [Penicillium brevicompactum]|uniref:Heat shock protein DnaJ N-terminal n=1 Tax=Penicillium brevicompactum TaxID=5074 RepID=A0A9W9R339_PENBR|nr:Heat shock protein DnaJ N-terminal [Penicillium brevicompactum]
MVKSDVRKDYYADLGLQPSAEAEDVKRQFRKLALKYHPDRNPGREVEFNAKFQAIQAANEILSDPHQRLKYDTDRLRAGYGKNYGPTRANTQRKTQPTSYPPRPTGTPAPSASAQYTKTPPNGPSAGARRYASHARAGPQQWKPQDNAQTRADAFKGFNNMRGGQSAGWQGFDPSTGRASAGTPGPGAQRHPFGASAQSARPKSAFETFQNAQPHTQSQSTKKKQGFAPGAAGGDEPMARNTSAYSSSSRAERPSSQYYEPAPPPTAKKASEPEPVQQTYTPEFERHSRSYAQAGKGEKTFFSSTGLGRSQTMRTPSGTTRPNVNANTSSPTSGRSGRYRSASPKARRNPNNYDSTSSSESEDIPKPKAVPKSRLRAHQNFADFHRQQAQSPKNGKRPMRYQHLIRPRSHYNRDPTQDAVYAIVIMLSHAKTRRERAYFLSLLNIRHHFKKTADRIDPKGHASDSAAFPKSSFRPTQQPDSSGSSSSINAETGISPERPERPQTTAFGNSSTSELHKKFSADDWRKHIERFDFIGSSSPSKESLPRSPGSQNRGRTPQRNGNAPPVYNQGTTATQQPTSSSQTQQQPTPFAQAKFSADSWSERLQNLHWGPDAEKTRQTANSAPPRSPKKPTRSGTKLRSAPQPASVATEADEAKDTINGHPPSVPPRAPAPDVDVEEMDLDEDFPPSKPNPPPVPRKAPHGRSGSASNLDPASQPLPRSPGSQPLPESPAKKPRPPPRAENNTPISPPRPALFNLGNLRNAAPFTNTNSGGIENLEDIHTTLPFQSQAKQPATTKRDIQPRDLQLPDPPKRPWAPKPITFPGASAPILPRDKWNWYVSAMGAYMHEWNIFNRRMLTHLNIRQDANETGLAPGWISAVGDSTRLKIGDEDDLSNGKTKVREDSDLDEFLIPGSAKGGFSAYLRGVEEDIHVRKHWDVATEMHRECIIDLGRLREWIRNGGKVA